MSEARSDSREGATRNLTLTLDAFAWEALAGEAKDMAVSMEELANFAILYYLADYDSGRVARQMSPRATDDGGAEALSELRAHAP